MMGPTIPYYYAIVLGLSLVLIIGLILFIVYLRIGLNSEEADIIDKKPKTLY